MGEFSSSANANIGLSVVEISVNSAKSNPTTNSLFYTTPTTSSSSSPSSATSGNAVDQTKVYNSTMQDDLSASEKNQVSSVSVSGGNAEELSLATSSSSVATSAIDKNSITSAAAAAAVSKDCENSVNDLSDKLNDQVSRNSKTVPSLQPLFHPAEASTPAGALWSTAIEDGYAPNFANVNGGMGFQNFSSSTQQQQLFGGNNMNQNHVNQGRRAITASHNFPHNMARQQSLSNHPLYKGYGSWANPPPGQNWSPGNSSVWNRGRSVPNLPPLQQIGVGLGGAGRKPSPTFNQQQVISPVKFRRSTSYPGKGPFPQPPTFEITNMDEARELLPYQDRCGVVSANGNSPLENMRGLEHYLNDIMSPQSNTTDMKGFINTNMFPSLQLHGKSHYFPSLDDQAGPVLLEEPSHLVDSTLGTQPLSSPSRSSPHSQGSEGGERFSRKVFVGGLPPDIDEDEITVSFRRFGPLVVDWPHKAESKSYFPPKGYAFLLFQDENSVQSLIDACITDEDKLYLCVSSPTIKDKPVQIRPWRLSDADFVLDASMPLDPRKTVFVGGVPRPLKAVELAMIMDRLYGGVCYAGIDTDPELKYPKGAGRVAFSNQQSYIAAISARFVQLQHGDIDKRVEVKPYVLDDQMCDECQGQRCGGKFAPFFCANVTCLQYYCEHCWATIHSRPGREFHKPLVKEGADRPRAVPFRWC
ncbi:cytoplasmic polyadenylation element-binding protein 2 isoform X2 [Diorhabda carinulata]|uniref:cytoplasmic polyadenylation element-binding protein 2 isoform X2 n=1 Tax=Diorhabda carinulata TaxID=1163345 RepID=UPI0025A2E75E|nr:cytoplasmic polyadenylation element-binding protein 2 isoform X2 [Diorhabda carinulata]